MKQVSKKKPVVKKRTVKKKAVRPHPKYGTSKLEEDFATITMLISVNEITYETAH